MTQFGSYHGLPDETGLAVVFLMLTRPLPRMFEADGTSFTTFPAREGEERPIEEAAMLKNGKKRFNEALEM